MLGPTAPINKRYSYLIIAVGVVFGLSLVLFFRSLAQGTRHPDYINAQVAAGVLSKDHLLSSNIKAPSLKGHAIAPKLGNETAKAELGRAAWKLFHTTFARFPDKPTADESAALESYIYLFQRLYPCGECAAHFGQILDEFPPQVRSRSSAAAWGCHVHNEVNKSLGKTLFDCSNIGDFYDCGCADGPEGADNSDDDDEVDNDAKKSSNSNKNAAAGKRPNAKQRLAAWAGSGNRRPEKGSKRRKWKPMAVDKVLHSKRWPFASFDPDTAGEEDDASRQDS